jgi:phospholipid/cholesterol/gamma-HCH transport system substrate-binding protein
MANDYSLPSPRKPEPRRWAILLIVSVGLLTVAGLSLKKISSGSSLRLRTCFQDASGLRPGAKVRLAGVEIGAVREVRAQPTSNTCPAAVQFEIKAPYELRIPKDSVASTATAGLLGETYLAIDASRCSGPPASGGDQIPSKESVKFTAATMDRAIKAVELMKELSDEEKNSSAQPRPRAGDKP